jgi:BirA family biotin operon repressor/biotin-[acetyl-CoA-carboxylase] ligase
MAAGVACARAIRGVCGVDAAIKWPNDVMVEGKKLAGILAESRVAESVIETAIVGMGVNLRLPVADMPLEIAARAVSLADLVQGDPPSPRAVLSEILRELEPLYRLVLAGGDEVIDEANALCETLGKSIVVRFPDGSTEEGRADVIGPDGRLRVSGSHTRWIDVAEVEQVREG